MTCRTGRPRRPPCAPSTSGSESTTRGAGFRPRTTSSASRATSTWWSSSDRFPPCCRPSRVSRVIPGRAVARATLRRRGDPSSDSHPVVTGAAGGLVAPGYTHYASEAGGRERRQWYVNPFEFFRRAFGTDDLPKPDPTTVSPRIFYSHIDGDGWRNAGGIEPYREASRVGGARGAGRNHRQVPRSAGHRGAHPRGPRPGLARHRGRPRAAARAIFTRAHVEVSSHTYSHPLDWRFFERYDRALEARYARSGQQLRARSDAAMNMRAGAGAAAQLCGPPVRPRHGNRRVNRGVDPAASGRQARGAAAVVRRHAAVPRGDGGRAACGPPRDQRRGHALRRGLPVLSRGSPVGRQVGQDWQVYSSNSNENTYTDLWTDRFFGFMFLMRTIRNTELPLRVKPFNVYYHMYLGEKLAALNAVRRNLEHARARQWRRGHEPLRAIAEGFFAARVEQLGTRRWRLANRGALSTIRFDRASRLGVDFDRSTGVIGARHQHGALYVALDEEARGAGSGVARPPAGGADPDRLAPVPRPCALAGLAPAAAAGRAAVPRAGVRARASSSGSCRAVRGCASRCRGATRRRSWRPAARTAC